MPAARSSSGSSGNGSRRPEPGRRGARDARGGRLSVPPAMLTTWPGNSRPTALYVSFRTTEDTMLTTRYVPGTPNWLDPGTPDVDAAVAFYSAVFGWRVTSAGPESGGYGFFQLDGRT